MKTPSNPGFENRFSCLSGLLSLSSKSGFVIPASPQLSWSERAGQILSLEDAEKGEMAAGYEPRLPPLALQLV